MADQGRSTGIQRARTFARLSQLVTGPAIGRWLAWAVLALGLSVTAYEFTIIRRDAMHDAQERFNFRVREIESAIQQRMHAYEQVLHCAVGLFNAVGDVDRVQWRAFAEKLNLGGFNQGIQGLAYVEHVPANSLAEHIRAVRRQGIFDYDVKVEHPRDSYAPVKYIAPFNKDRSRTLGFDCYSEPIRRTALETSRDSANATICGKIVLRQDQDGRPSFGMIMPVYRINMPTDTIDQRRAALRGYVGVPIRMKDLMAGILGPGDQSANLHIFDGDQFSPQALMYDQDGALSDPTRNIRSSLLRTVRPLENFGHHWLIDFRSTPGFDRGIDTAKAWTILGLGVAISLLLFGIVWTLASTRNRAIALATGMTRRIRQDESLLKRKGQELEEFVYAVSHDLKSPLVAIQGYIGHLQRDFEKRKLDELPMFAQRISAAAGRMFRHIEDLLELSRIGRVPDQREPVNLSELAHSLGEELRPRIEQLGADYRTHSDLPTVYADRDRLWQLLENLVTNALKFSAGSHPPKISVSADRIDDEWRLIVRDNGIGIDPRHHDRIFGMFQRLDREPEGSGVGLAIVKRIAQLHGGDVRVESTLGNGAAFIVTFDAQLWLTSRAAA